MTAVELSTIIKKLIEKERENENSPLKNIKSIVEGETNSISMFLLVRFENEDFTILSVKLPKD